MSAESWPAVVPIGQGARLPEPGSDDGPATSWRAVDLGPFLDGSHRDEEPDLLRRQDSVPLLYRGRVHWCQGEPEAMKTFFALLGTSQCIQAGEHVVYVDLEDSPAGIVGRLLAMGPTAEQVTRGLTYLAPEGALGFAARTALEPVVRGAALVVIDACTEALALQGLSSKDDTDIATWLNLLPRWAARLGPAVLVLDHVVKDSETRGRWATGSQHKLSGLDGAAYGLEAVTPGGRGMTGRSRLIVTKDRHGQVRPHARPITGGRHWVADLVVDSTGPWTEVALHAPTEREDPFLPTAVMTKVAAALAGAPLPLTKGAIEDRVPGRAVVIRQALAALVDGGYVTATNGPRGAVLHELVKPYPEEQT